MKVPHLCNGDQALVTSTNRLYIYSGSGWYNIALINTTPYWSSEAISSYDLSTTGGSTVITILAVDSEGVPITYTATTDSDFDSIATITKDSDNGRTFTVIPTDSENGTAIAGTGTVTFKASDGVNLVSTLSTFSIAFKVTNSKYTTFLLAADSASLDNPILDVSSNELTISKAGNLFSNSFSPYHPGGYSTYFDGSGDYLTVTTDTSLQFGTGDFTIEGWIYLISRSNTRNGIFGNYSSYSAGSLGMFAGHSSGSTTAYQVAYNGATFPASVIQGGTIVYNQWVHFAVVRNSGTMDLYIDGTSVDSITATASIDGVGSNFVIGCPGDNLGSSMHGYLRDFRVVKGTAVYTSNFTPQTSSLTAVTNTSLLTCHLPYIADGSTNDHTVTSTGNTSTKRFGPYDYRSYTKADHGGSVYFDGSGDYLTGASDNGLIASGNGFTVEGWVYWTSISNYSFIAAASTGANSYIPYWYVGSSNTGYWRYSMGDATEFATSVPIDMNCWNHFALVTTSGGDGTLYVNGKSIATRTGMTLNGSATGVAMAHIGGGPNVGGYNLTGYVADVRYVNNSSVYTAEFTPPTAPLTAISGTQFLTCKNQGTIYDKAGSMVDVILDYGQPSSPAITSSSTQRKFTTSNSIVLANNAEGIDIQNFPLIGTEPFTVEGWFYHTLTNQAAIYFSAQTDNTFQIKSDYIDANRWFYTVVASTGYNFQYTSGDTMLNTWNHIVLQRNSSNVLQMFLNGTSLGTQASVTGNVNTNNDMQLFAGAEGGGYTNFEGYVQDFRVSVGIARYSGNFTPPTSEFTG